jgi:hypothetical protein
VRSYSIYEHDTTLKIAFGATFFLADFNTGPPIHTIPTVESYGAGVFCSRQNPYSG